jgi:small-conductance mechanosensitive channel
MEGIFKKLVTEAVLFAPKIVVGLVIFFAFWIVGIIVQNIVRRIGEGRDLNRDVLRLIEQTTKITLITVGAVTALGTMSINVATLVAGLGLTGFALGFALKDILSNLLSGVLILMYKPFRRNDYISVAGVEGTVVEIDLRYTTLQTEDKTILIPNSTLFTNTIIVLKTQGNITPSTHQ